MAEGMAEQLKNTLICPLCARVLDDARVLKCGHMFCFMCIKQSYERHGLNKGDCPVCGEPYFLKQRDTQYLSKAFVVNDILDILNISINVVYQCAFCHSGEGSLVCLKCKLNMCKYCSKKTVSFCGHQTVTVEYLNTDPFLRDIIHRSKSKQTCPSHSDEDLSCFCQNCKQVICDVCLNEAHRQHHVTSLTESVTSIKNRNIPQRLENKGKELEKFLQKLEEPANKLHGVTRVSATDAENQLCQSNRDKCSALHRQLWDLFMYGSEKAILELFYKQEDGVDQLLNYDPTKETLMEEEYYKSMVQSMQIANSHFHNLLRGETLLQTRTMMAEQEQFDRLNQLFINTAKNISIFSQRILTGTPSRKCQNDWELGSR